MDKIVLNARERKRIGKGLNALRREGGLPGIIYGGEIDPVPVILDMIEASKLLSNVTSSQLITLKVDGDTHNALVRGRQRHPIRGDLLHVDFQAVSMTEKLKASIPLVMEGEAPARTEYDAVIVSGIESLDVQSLPEDLPERIIVDVTRLVEIGDALYVRDLSLPPNVEILTDLDELVAVANPQMAEEIEEEVVEEELEEELEEPEIIERGKREEEGFEGEGEEEE